MTDQELIKALRCCISYANCDMCQSECIFYKDPKSSECIPAMGETVIARLEALLAENEGLKADKDMNASAKRLTASELEKMNCPVWVKIFNGGMIDGYWCLCNMGHILTPSGRGFCVKEIPDWEFYRNPPSTEGVGK